MQVTLIEFDKFSTEKYFIVSDGWNASPVACSLHAAYMWVCVRRCEANNGRKFQILSDFAWVEGVQHI